MTVASSSTVDEAVESVVDVVVDGFNDRSHDYGVDASMSPLAGCLAAHVGTDGWYLEPSVGLSYAVGTWLTVKPRGDQFETGWQPDNKIQFFAWAGPLGNDYTSEDELFDGDWSWTGYHGIDILVLGKSKVGVGAGFTHSWGRYEISWGDIFGSGSEGTSRQAPSESSSPKKQSDISNGGIR